MTPFGQPPSFLLEVEVRPPEALDPPSGGPVRLVSIAGGRVLGDLTGRIVPGGTDWQTVREDGTIEIEARYLLELDDGTRIELQSRGLRAAGASAFWSSIWLRSTADTHRELDRTQYLARGCKQEHHVAIEVYALPS